MKILIIPAPAQGHIIPTIRVAKILQAMGHKITYFIDTTMQQTFESQGFDTIIGNSILFFNRDMGGIFEQRDKTFYERLLDRLSNITLKGTIESLNNFEKAIDKLAPDLVLLDVFLSYNFILLKYRRPTIFFQTMVSTYKDSFTPPLNSKIQPKNVIGVNIQWFWYKIKRQWLHFISFGESNWGLTKRTLKKLNRTFDFSQLNWYKCFHVGIQNIPEWVLSPIEFDFPRNNNLPFQHHIGPTIDINRKEKIDENYTNLIAKIEGKKIAYCSLGTISITHNKNSEAFFKKVADVFSDKKDWVLIISSGQSEAHKLGIIGSNIHIFQRVPQLDVIKRSHLVITHGGLNTVMECILLATPMLVFPLNSKWDQNGNAARVVYHKLGLMGDIDTITPQKLSNMFDEIEENKAYQSNMESMSSVFQKRSDELESKILVSLLENNLLDVSPNTK